jgi:ssDNA-binding Zn-finger/Zn-ribbon topoisomerase 1
MEMTKKPIKVQCPYCRELVVSVRKSRARWVGGVAGAGLGAKIGGSLGIAGGILGLSVATAGTYTVAAIGLGFGYFLAEKAFTKSRCPNCNEKLN